MQSLIQAVERSLSAGRGVRRRLPGGGRLEIDRPQPFLVVHRRRSAVADRATDKLIAHGASVLTIGEGEDVADLLEMIVRRGAEAFGAFLVLEVWAGPEPEPGEPPRFVVYGPKRPTLIRLVESLQRQIAGIRLAGQPTEVAVRRGLPPAPPGLDPLLTEREARACKCIRFGLQIPPVHRDPATGDAWPQILRSLRRDLTLALRRWAHRFLRSWTTLRPKHSAVIGSRTIARPVWQVDQALAKVADSFDFLLLVTPVNVTEAWRDFKASEYQQPPVLQYRPMPVEPTLLKRALFAVPIERVDDPALYQLFREKQDELDRQITLLLDMNTPRFMHGSIQLFGGVDDELNRVAREMLERMPPTAREKPDVPALSARAFAERAEAEVKSFRRQWPGCQGPGSGARGCPVGTDGLQRLAADRSRHLHPRCSCRSTSSARSRDPCAYLLERPGPTIPAALFGFGRIRPAPRRSRRVGGGIRRRLEPVARTFAVGPCRRRASHDGRGHLRRHLPRTPRHLGLSGPNGVHDHAADLPGRRDSPRMPSMSAGSASSWTISARVVIWSRYWSGRSRWSTCR